MPKSSKAWWELPAIPTANRGTYENPPDLGAENWVKMRFNEIEYNGAIRWQFTRQSCMHCSEAPCVWVCPTYARQYDSLGSVAVDPERCIACGRCAEYCPYEVPSLGSDDVSPRISVERGKHRLVTYKCRFCTDRIEDGHTPACVKTCPPGAMQFGDRDDLVRRGRFRVQALTASYPQANLYGERELGGLHVLYVLTEEPSLHGLPENPRLGNYPEFVDTTFPDWYVETIATGSLPVFPPEARREWYMQPDLVPASRPGEPAWPAGRPGRGLGWGVQALWGWFGLGVVGAGAALWWVIRRRMSPSDTAGDVKAGAEDGKDETG
jgi:formate dehydrogenase iron-sulfur subunit